MSEHQQPKATSSLQRVHSQPEDLDYENASRLHQLFAALAAVLRRVVVISIAGNIAVGKTTLLTALTMMGFVVLKEEVEHWGPALRASYEDPIRESFGFQQLVLHGQHKMRKLIESMDYTQTPVVFVERSTLEGAHVFVHTKYEAGEFSSHCVAIHDMWAKEFGLMPDLAIFLDAPANVAYERLLRRARDSESSVPREYLERLDKRYKRLQELLQGHSLVVNYANASWQDVLPLMIGFVEHHIEHFKPLPYHPVTLEIVQPSPLAAQI